MHTEEKFDVVDHKNKPIYYVTGKEELHKKKHCHHAGHYHNSVHIFVEVTGGKFIVQLKAKGTENEGKWSSSASGHVRAGEALEDAAVRELEEELGLEIGKEELDFVITLWPSSDSGYEFSTLYTYLMDENTERIKIDREEVEAIMVCKLDDLVKNVDENKDRYSPIFVELLNIFLEIYKT